MLPNVVRSRAAMPRRRLVGVKSEQSEGGHVILHWSVEEYADSVYAPVLFEDFQVPALEPSETGPLPLELFSLYARVGPEVLSKHRIELRRGKAYVLPNLDRWFDLDRGCFWGFWEQGCRRGGFSGALVAQKGLPGRSDPVS